MLCPDCGSSAGYDLRTRPTVELTEHGLSQLDLEVTVPLVCLRCGADLGEWVGESEEVQIEHGCTWIEDEEEYEQELGKQRFEPSIESASFERTDGEYRVPVAGRVKCLACGRFLPFETEIEAAEVSLHKVPA